MGEVSHSYRIKGKYYIVSAIPGAHVPMKCARADKLTGPWEVTTISEEESLGIGQGYRPKDNRRQNPPFELNPPDPSERLSLDLHQGGIIETPSGEWWGFSMQDHNSVGRLTSLSPVTWVDGWPYFGLPGNLMRTPSIWVKPNTGVVSPITSPYGRDDDFSGPKLIPVWQWNHLPDDSKWSLSERPGYLRLHSLPATDFWWARNSLTERAIGPESTATTELDGSGLQTGHAPGLALLNSPYAWIGLLRDDNGYALAQYDHITGKTVREPVTGPHVWLSVHSDFDTEISQFSYSSNGKEFKPLGPAFVTVFQLRTFQGVRFALFNYNTGGAPGGHADFNFFTVDEPRPRGLTKPIPVSQSITLTDLANGNALAVVDGKLQSVIGADKATAFRVVDQGRGRIALQTKDGKYISVGGEGKSGEVAVKSGKPGGRSENRKLDDAQRCIRRARPIRQGQADVPAAHGSNLVELRVPRDAVVRFIQNGGVRLAVGRNLNLVAKRSRTTGRRRAGARCGCARAEPAACQKLNPRRIHGKQLLVFELRNGAEIHGQRRLHVVFRRLPPGSVRIVKCVGRFVTRALAGECAALVHGPEFVHAEWNGTGVAVARGVGHHARGPLRRLTRAANKHISVVIESYRVHADAAATRRIRQNDGIEHPPGAVRAFHHAAMAGSGHDSSGLAQKRVARRVDERPQRVPGGVNSAGV